MNQMLEELSEPADSSRGLSFSRCRPTTPEYGGDQRNVRGGHAAVPRIFQTGGEGVGATFTSIVLLMHMLALTGKDEPDVARKNEADLKAAPTR